MREYPKNWEPTGVEASLALAERELEIGTDPDERATLDCVRRLIFVDRLIRLVESVLKQHKADRERMREIVAERLTFEGSDGVKLCGKTVYPQRKVHAKLVRDAFASDADMVAVLRKFDMGDLPKLSVNAASFAAAMREIIEQRQEEDESLVGQPAEKALPEELRPYVRCFEETKAQIRSA